MCPLNNRGLFQDWDRLSQLLELGFARIIEDPSLERELITLVRRMSVDRISSPEFCRVFKLTAPNVAERLQVFKDNKAKLKAAKEGVDIFGENVETYTTVLDILDNTHKVTMLGMQEQVTLLDKQRKIDLRLQGTEVLLADLANQSNASILRKLTRMRESFVEHFDLLERNISRNTFVITILKHQVTSLRSTCEVLNKERNEAYHKAVELDGLARGCAEENSKIDQLNNNLERLIVNELCFVHSIAF